MCCVKMLILLNMSLIDGYFIGSVSDKQMEKEKQPS